MSVPGGFNNNKPQDMLPGVFEVVKTSEAETGFILLLFQAVVTIQREGRMAVDTPEGAVPQSKTRLSPNCLAASPTFLVRCMYFFRKPARGTKGPS